MTWPPVPSPLGRHVDVVGIGEALVLLQPAAGGTLTAAEYLEVHVAGAELNTCAAVASLGGRAVLATRVGADPLSDRVRAAADGLSVEVDVEVDQDRASGVLFKETMSSGARRVYYYRSGSAASHLSATDAPRVLDRHPRSCLLSGITIALGPGPSQAVLAVAAGAKRVGAAVVLDVNLRPQLGDSARTVEQLRSILPLVDLLVTGTDEAHALFGVTEPTSIAAAALQWGVHELVITGGEAGCWWVDQAAVPHHQPSRAQEVVDPVGAGDAFTGGYLAGRLCGASSSAAARLGSELAARVIASTGDTAGLPSPADGRILLQQVLGISPAPMPPAAHQQSGGAT